MTLWGDRLAASSAVMRCPEAWALPLWVGRAFLTSVLSTRPVAAPTGRFLYPNVPALGTAGYRRYLKGLRRLSLGEHVPLAAHVSVTDRCGYRCARCSNLSRSPHDPPLNSVVRLLAELRAAGVASVAFTGGEPLLRDDLSVVVRACSEGVSATVLTSGQRLDLRRARELRSAGLARLHVSLDHFSAEEHDRVRGQAGAFAQALRAIRASSRAGLYTAVQAVLGASLLREEHLQRFLAFCRDLGVHEVILLEPVPIRRCEPCAPLDRAARDRLRAWHLRSAWDATLPKVTSAPFLEGPELQGCQAGYSFLHVSADGEVLPCDLAPISFGNAYQEGLSVALARLARHFRRPSGECFALRMLALSGGSTVPATTWPEAERLMRSYEPGRLPALMEGLPVRQLVAGRAGRDSGFV